MVVKKLGKGIARSRANLSYEQGKGTDSSDLSLYVHSSGLRGWCLKDNILGLLDYFESLDDLAPGFQFCYCTDCSKFLSPFV